MIHPFFSAEIARQRQESLRASASMARRRAAGSTDEAPAAPIRWEALTTRMAELGPGSLEVEVRAVVRAARDGGVEPAVVGVLADPHAPEIARQRAFGRILRELASRPGRAMSPDDESSHDAA